MEGDVLKVERSIEGDAVSFTMFCRTILSREYSDEARLLTDSGFETSSWSGLELDDNSLCLLIRNEERMKLRHVSTTFVIWNKIKIRKIFNSILKIFSPRLL